MKLIETFKQFLRDEEGVSAVEYGLVLALVGLAVGAGAGEVGTAINDALGTLSDRVGNTINPTTPTTPAAP